MPKLVQVQKVKQTSAPKVTRESCTRCYGSGIKNGKRCCKCHGV